MAKSFVLSKFGSFLFGNNAVKYFLIFLSTHLFLSLFLGKLWFKQFLINNRVVNVTEINIIQANIIFFRFPTVKLYCFFFFFQILLIEITNTVIDYYFHWQKSWRYNWLEIPRMYNSRKSWDKKTYKNTFRADHFLSFSYIFRYIKKLSDILFLLHESYSSKY